MAALAPVGDRGGDAVNAAVGALAGRLRRLGRSARPALGRRLVIALPYLWLSIFFLMPFLIVLKIAFSNVQLSMPPVEPVFTWAADQVVQIRLH